MTLAEYLENLDPVRGGEGWYCAEHDLATSTPLRHYREAHER